jgi:lipoate-protein ligase A
MLAALNPRQAKIESKAVQSVRNFVTNLRELLPSDMTIEELKLALLRGIFKSDEIPEYRLSEEDWEQIRQISTERYSTWEWNYGRSPKFNIQKSDRLPAGKIDARMDVEGGLIRGIRIFGDFAGVKEIAELEEKLVGIRYDRETIENALGLLDLSAYFGSLTASDLAALLY